jgi:glucosamine--fructose-6-phosphate aminotransferase (isomerizing)
MKENPPVMSQMGREIEEQPRVVAGVASDAGRYEQVCARAREAGVRFVLYAARGTSDNAAVYGKYLASILAGLPAGLAVPSAATLYHAPMDLRQCLVVGISQSGRTPDVAEFLRLAGEGGALTVAITNEDDSPLARTANELLPTAAGPELAVPATKTYTSELAALAMLWATWSGHDELVRSLSTTIPEAMRAAIAAEDAVIEAARRLRPAERLLVAARGYHYATALEASLKLEETAYLAAMPYSTADLMHGPIALVDTGWPALLFGHPGPAEATLVEVEDELVRRGADVIVVAPPGPLLDAAAFTIPLPSGMPEELAPLVAIVPAQLLALHLATARGIDPDRPRGLSKVTRTL